MSMETWEIVVLFFWWALVAWIGLAVFFFLFHSFCEAAVGNRVRRKEIIKSSLKFATGMVGVPVGVIVFIIFALYVRDVTGVDRYDPSAATEEGWEDGYAENPNEN
jgi:hypothetical protein